VGNTARKLGLGGVIRRVKSYRTGIPAVGRVNFGDFRRLEPFSREYGFDRGGPIDRYYIESFLSERRELITGRVLEIGERLYTEMFGHDVTQSDMLHVDTVPGATYVDDLTEGASVPSSLYDCVILTQTLHLIWDMRAAVQTIYRILKPGGVLLCTVPGITQIADDDWNETWYWSLSRFSAKKLFEEVYPPGNVDVRAYGNFLSAVSFLGGLGGSELKKWELDAADDHYQVIIGVAARTGDARIEVEMADRWDYDGKPQFAYDEEKSYGLGMAFLDREGEVIEDWGCGTAFAKRFVREGTYIGVDGSASEYSDVKADLQSYRSDVDCIFMRHVLEHNWGWRKILANAIGSFRKRMVLIVFTPLGTSEQRINPGQGSIPDLQFDREELLSYFGDLNFREETFPSKTEYGVETMFYLER
jgi:SAM-dependent methyltransferase